MSISYDGMHKRVYARKGKASQYPCVDCDQQATDWSQIHGTDPADPENYEPRCKKCHGSYDVELKPRGERHGNSKLTDAQRRGIAASVGATQEELAQHFGISQTQVSTIRRKFGLTTRADAKLTEAQRRGVLASLLRKGTSDLRELAEHLSVSEDLVRLIRKNGR